MMHAEADNLDDNIPTSDAVLVSTADARNQFGDLINRVAYGREHIVLTRRGKELVAIIPVEELRWMEEFENRRDLELIDRILADPQREPPISLEELEAELAAERAAEQAAARTRE
ncbi:MAG TPA: type II toxin-antitoxin system Phd/YefM family antitoxin [Dehalococcoidia bacterium]|nr:type II toxin-antitoxin system Phd/YefM family antitoxin [Dehalococcoidia bacterium]